MTAKEHREAIRGMLGKIRPTADLDSLHRYTELIITVNKGDGATQKELEQWCLIRQILMNDYEAESLSHTATFLSHYDKGMKKRKSAAAVRQGAEYGN